ncbi:PAS domain S-box protein [Salinadaptatus halalkaliphilus]|uniref:PAS domain S-box protein n=1 Tax=Salinadaptatus halalkaliphilus TaxID=2419781 RepID=A0A4S3TSI7_9EURY|nr:bacterio-opsin activator domain-containing protein [Salinadaptatus halalkaliphilus]THE66353.1 PAS domain S-box protein [Salinadaptatus halalkaliphilus]
MSDSVSTATGDVRRVLVVGDSTALAATVEALANAFDPTAVVRAPTVEDARDRLAESTVDCLVCPFDSESEDSPLRTLAAEFDAIPIVALTDPAAQESALDAGATDVLEPAASSRVVATRVSNAMARAHRQDSEDQRYRSILASTTAIVWVLESDGTIAYASPSIERRLGQTPHELEGASFTQVVHPEDRTAIRETISTVSSAQLGEHVSTTVRLGRGDGTWIAVDLTAVNRLGDPAVGGIVATTTVPAVDDRGALDRLEEAAFTLGPHSELRYYNDRARQLFDGDPVPGTVVWNLLDESLREMLYEYTQEARATASTVEFGLPAPDGDGRLLVTVAPGDDGVTVLARELPEDESIDDERLRAVDYERLELLEAIVDTIADGIAIVEDSTLSFANATLTEWSGGESPVGLEIDDVFDADLAATVGERAASALVRWMEPIEGRLTVDPESRPIDVYVAPLPEDDRTLCVIRDRRRSGSETLSALHRTGAALRRASTRRSVRQHALEGIVDATDADYVGWYRLEDGLLRPAATATETAGEVVEPPAIAYDGTPIADVLDGTDGVVERADLGPVLSRAGIRAERVLAIATETDGIVLAASTDPFPDHRFETVAIETIVDAATGTLETLAARDRVRACQRDRTRLEGRVSQARQLQAIERDLLTAETRTAVEQCLCDGVGSLTGDDSESSGAIELAWVGRVDAGSERITPQTWAGSAVDAAAETGEGSTADGGSLPSLLESLSIPVDPDSPAPAGQAAATHEVTATDDLETVATDASGTLADWYRALTSRGVGHVVSLPIEHDGFRYGVLTLYAKRPEDVDEHRHNLCLHLAAVAGHAISSIQRTQALLADTVTELEVGLENDHEPLSAVATALERRVDVRSVVPRSSGGSTVYCTIANTDPTELRSMSDAVDGLESVRHVGEEIDGSPIELVFERETVAETVAEHGGRVRSIAPDGDRTRLVIDLSTTIEVRSFLDVLERSFPNATLLARREHDRSARPRRAFDAELRDQLSERQLRTLETAYYSGFFEWPRESTGEEVAESLGVSQPTFSRHFRTAQRKLFELLFEDRLESNGNQLNDH